MILTGTALRAARAILKISQLELADSIGCSHQVIQSMENNDGIITSSRASNVEKVVTYLKSRNIDFKFDGTRVSVFYDFPE